MGKERINFFRALVHKAVCNLAEGVAADCEIINNHAGFAFYIADNLKCIGVFIVADANLVADCNIAAENVCVCPCTLCRTRIGRNDNEIFINNAEVPRIFAEQCTCVKVIDGFREETLNLCRMKVHCNNPVGTAHLDAVRTDSCADGNTGFILFVGFCIAEIRNNCGY